MNYLLLTGSTGLVGRYLLRNLLAQGERVAVLVRSSRLQSARERIESVMAHWERAAGRSLGRPVVLEGDLCSDHLGMDPSARSWVAHNCRAVLHSAASMTFREDKNGEPHRTNVDGMQRILELCSEANIREFHHVSTAYICGLREGRILETEIDLGQNLGNVYEQSKLAAEKMVRAADFLDVLTIYRPASVIGDSQTGFCTSLHGFYLPLQLAYSIANRVPPEFMNERFFSRLGLNGDEGKNFVPVDWLAEAITHLVRQPEHHGKTYHLASPSPVTVRLFTEIVQQSMSRFCERRNAEQLNDEQLAVIEQHFHDHMLIYRSHWRTDPQFDLTNTRAALPHLQCPEMNRDLLLRVARYPIELKFAVDRFQPASMRYDVAEHLARRFQPQAHNTDWNPALETVALQVNGSGGGQWHLSIQDGRITSARPGLGPAGARRLYLNTETFAALSTGRLAIDESINLGRLVVEGVTPTGRDDMQIVNQLVARG